MKCKNCQCEILDDALFCYNCGSKIEHEEDVIEGDIVDEEMDEEVSLDDNIKSTNNNTFKHWFDKTSCIQRIKFFVGGVVVIIGLLRILMAMNHASFPNATFDYFGADYYTYMYASVQDVILRLVSIDVSLGLILVAIGVLIGISGLKD